FDEADAMFGKRTEVRDAHDRFANAQTNFLLQRLENYDGIVLLTSNSRARFDPAFARRLDLVVEFPSPGPEEPRALALADPATPSPGGAGRGGLVPAWRPGGCVSATATRLNTPRPARRRSRSDRTST